MTNENKVVYGLKNLHLAVLTETSGETGETTYAYNTPQRVPGVVSLSLDPQGEQVSFAADDNPNYYIQSVNGGYSGTLTIANCIGWVRENILNEKKDAKGVYIENSGTAGQTKYFALLFEVNGDAKANRFCFYRCALGRPKIESKTVEGTTVEVQTAEFSLTASARDDGQVKAVTNPDTDAATYSGWYTRVYEETPVSA